MIDEKVNRVRLVSRLIEKLRRVSGKVRVS